MMSYLFLLFFTSSEGYNFSNLITYHIFHIPYFDFAIIKESFYQTFVLPNQDMSYSKTCVKRPLSKRQKVGFQDQV